jgi:hypothetical protein
MSSRRYAGSFAAMSDRLQRYREKRKPSSTPEPGPKGPSSDPWVKASVESGRTLEDVADDQSKSG